MKKTIYIIFLIVITTGLKAQFAGVLKNGSFTRLENDVAIFSPDENLRGSFQWQNSADSIDLNYKESGYFVSCVRDD